MVDVKAAETATCRAGGRRGLSALLLVAVLLAAGCTTPVANGTPTPTGSDAPSVKPFPTFPDPLTADTVGPYVADYEAVYRHNAILAAADGVTSISVGCEAESVTATDEGYEVVVGCGFSWMYEDDGAAGIADGRPYRATYQVTDGGLTERIGSTL